MTAAGVRVFEGEWQMAIARRHPPSANGRTMSAPDRLLALHAAARQDRRAKPSRDAVENHGDCVDLMGDIQLQSPRPEVSLDRRTQAISNRRQDIATRRRLDKGDWGIVGATILVRLVDKEQLRAKQRRRRDARRRPGRGHHRKIKAPGADAVAQNMALVLRNFDLHLRIEPGRRFQEGDVRIFTML